MKLITLQIKTSNNFNKNLKKLKSKITNTPINSIILAPELVLNGYAYDRLDKAVKITTKAIPKLKKLSKNRTIALTMTTIQNEKYYNTLHIFYNGKLVHTQSKNKIFVLNDERKFFEPGNIDDIKIVNINGIKIATLICFELRFIELWERVKGADIILVPAMWGKTRKENFETLTQALAVGNQCFVIASDSANNDMAKSSAIITPFGNVYKDDKKKRITKDVDFEEIQKMRKYLDVGIE